VNEARRAVVHFVVPDGIDDPQRVSGGNRYDQQVRDGLRGSGWDLRMILVPEIGTTVVASALAELPDEALVLVDGLVAVREPPALGVHANRLRIVVLAHMVASATPQSSSAGMAMVATIDGERQSLRAAKRIITTSEFTRAELLAGGFAAPGTVVVARAGTQPAAATIASPSGGRLLCVGVVAPHKGQDLLIRALSHLTDVDGWRCTVVGSLDAAPAFVDDLAQSVRDGNLATRVSFTGVLAGKRLDDAYSRADLLVLPSRSESFGMVVAEGVARGIPVVAARVGGIPEAIPAGASGVFVPPEDPWAFEMVLRHWWGSPQWRRDLKDAAMLARATTRSWSDTIALIDSTLAEVAFSAAEVSA